MTPDSSNSEDDYQDQELGSPSRPESPSPPSVDTTEWIMHSLIRMHDQLKDIQMDVGDLKERTARFEEKLESIARAESVLQSLEKRVRNLEHRFWIAVGIFVVIAFLARIFLPDFDITFTTKP
ncbi:MAG: hypothetical protein OXU79_19030 [Gemmatimonadota bacterium]|nr:hypothetical protein [Gemmatimonadota bacterium]